VQATAEPAFSNPPKGIIMNVHHPVSIKSLLAATTFAATFAAFAGEPIADPQTGAAVTVTASRLNVTEEAYVNRLYDQLNRTKRYPTGREASLTRPEGTAVVWVDVARDGHVVARGVEQTSYSMLLDDMAVALVGRTSYDSLPADGWTDGPTHRFIVGYRFSPDAASRNDEQVAVVVSR